MAFGDRIKNFGKPPAPKPGAPVFDWPQGDPAFDVAALKVALRRGWRLDHLDHDSTAEERAEAAGIVATLVAYVGSLPLDLADRAAVYFTQCITMEPKHQQGDTP